MTPENEGGPGNSAPATTTDINPHHDDQADGVEFSSDEGQNDSPAGDDLFAFLYYALGETPGQLCVAVGHDPEMVDGRLKHSVFRQHWFSWPAQVEGVLALIKTASRTSDVYVSPYVMATASRAKGNAVEHRLVHCDVDREPFDEAKQAKLHQLGGFAVASGSDGHAHPYVRLTESVSTEEHERLCRELAIFLGGADPAKCSDNDLLRPPCTFNHKTKPGQPVSWLVEPTEATISPRELAEVLGVDLDAQSSSGAGDKASTNGQQPDEEEPVNLAWHTKVRWALGISNTPPDRSVDACRIVGACYDANLNLAQCERLIRERRSDVAGWIDENPPGELERTWEKIRAQREAEKNTATPESDGAKPCYVDMAAMLDGTLPEPPQPVVLKRQDGHCLFYKRRINSLFGDPEEGKTWIALASCAEELQTGGKAGILDFDHNGPEATAAALLALGAPHNALRDLNRFRYIEPEDMAETLRIVADFADWKPDVVVADSITELLTLLGKSSNSGAEYTAANRMVLQPIADAGTAAIAIDHPAKNVASRAMGPGGALAKRATIGGASLRVKRCRQFIPGKGGSAWLYINKDRPGGVRAHCPPSDGKGEQRAGTFIMEPPDVGGGMSWRIMAPRRDQEGLTDQQAQYLQAATEIGDWFTLKEIAAEVVRNDEPTRPQLEQARRACEALTKEEPPLLECEPGGKGSGKVTTYRLAESNHGGPDEEEY